MKIKCDTQSLISYRDYLKTFYRNQRIAFISLKKKCENVSWNDSVYYEVISDINDAASEIASALSELSDGIRVRFLDELIPLVEQYIDTARRYPQ